MPAERGDCQETRGIGSGLGHRRDRNDLPEATAESKLCCAGVAGEGETAQVGALIGIEDQTIGRAAADRVAMPVQVIDRERIRSRREAGKAKGPDRASAEV